MRATLLIFAALGLLAICLAVVIGTGLVHLSALDPVARPPGATGGTGVAQASADADAEDAEGGDAATRPTTGPEELAPTLASRSVFLAAADAKLAGPAISLMDKNYQVLRTGADPGAAPAPAPDPHDAARAEPDGGMDRWGGRKHRARSYPPFLAKWASEKDTAEWTFPSPAAGTYSVTLIYAGPSARGDDAGAGPYVLSAGGEPLVVRLKPTAKPTAFEMVDVGTLDLPQGEVHLTIRPQGKLTGKDQVHLRSVRLFPAPTG